MDGEEIRLPTRLLVTIDTECDKTRSWHTARPLSFRGVSVGVDKLLQPLFQRFGIRPTYYVSQEVMHDGESAALLAGLKDVELATHLHGEYVAPIEMPGELGGTITNEMQWEYGPALEQAKLKTLTDTFTRTFGRRPKSFRAGRFGIGVHTGRILHGLGYSSDSSVTPHKDWESRLGVRQPDFRQCPERPYAMREDGNLFFEGESDFLELPITLLAPAAPGQPPLWFRPWQSDTAVLEHVVRQVAAQPPQDGIARPLVMMFHNMEVIPGASPYPQSIADVDRYLHSMHKTFELTSRLGIEPVTVAQYQAEWARCRSAVAA